MFRPDSDMFRDTEKQTKPGDLAGLKYRGG